MTQLLSFLCHLIWLKLTKKLKDKIWSKLWFDNFPVCHLVTLLVDKRWTILILVAIHSSTTFCPRNAFLLKFMSITAPANLGQILATQILSMSELGPCPHNVLKMSNLIIGPRHMAHGPPITHEGCQTCRAHLFLPDMPNMRHILPTDKL